MNDHFGGFDLNSFGLDSFANQQVQQQQVQQQQHGYIPNHGNASVVNNNTNGPCMDNYDPNPVLMPAMHTSPYNSIAAVGGQHLRNSNSNGSSKNGVMRNRHHQSNTHQIYMPAANIQTSSRRTSSSSQNMNQHQPQHTTQRQQQLHQHHLQTGFSDFEPIPMAKRGADGSNGRGMQHQIQTSSHNNTNSLSHRGAVQLSYQQQQQRQHSYHINNSNSNSRRAEEVSSSATNFFSMSSTSQSQQQNQYKKQKQQRQIQQHVPKPKPMKEEWLENLKIEVPGVSLKAMSGTEIIQRLEKRTNEVLTRYLPCVDFLVQCQQELRKGLQTATTKRYVNHMFRDAMTPREFHRQYIAQLPQRFYRKNRRVMASEDLQTAYKELEKLVGNAKGAESQGCEVVKNTFLGGMKDGESWGLRKWLSKQGGALHICNDTECLSGSCQKLDRELESTRKLAERLRPLAAAALKKLKSDIPTSYQEQSSAHPYLPFFHRLECALRGMSNFDPEDDDVICIIDDDEVEELKAKASSAPKASKKQKQNSSKLSGSNNCSKAKGPSGSSSSSKKRKATEQFVTTLNDDDSDIEILEQKPAPKRSNSNKTVPNINLTDTSDNVDQYDLIGADGVEDVGDESDIMQELLKTLDDNDPINFDDLEQKIDLYDEGTNDNQTSNISKFGAVDLADGLDSLAILFDSNQHYTVRPVDVEKESFWDERCQYASALRLFSEILRAPECPTMFLESIDEDELIQEGKLPYTDIVKHPLCFRDIVSALLQDFNRVDNSIECSNGTLPFGTTLHDWNMWKGRELLQAIDLVFLNSLAYGKANDGGGKSSMRSRTNKLRKVLWAGIKEVIDDSISESDAEERRRCTPTRRGESSGFVVRKGST